MKKEKDISWIVDSCYGSWTTSACGRKEHLK